MSFTQSIHTDLPFILINGSVMNDLNLQCGSLKWKVLQRFQNHSSTSIMAYQMWIRIEFFIKLHKGNRWHEMTGQKSNGDGSNSFKFSSYEELRLDFDSRDWILQIMLGWLITVYTYKRVYKILFYWNLQNCWSTPPSSFKATQAV